MKTDTLAIIFIACEQKKMENAEYVLADVTT